MSDDNPFLVNAFLVSYDNYAARKKEIRNLLLELVQIAQHLGMNDVTEYGFHKDNRKIYQWDTKHDYDIIFQKQRWIDYYSSDPENSKTFTKAQLHKNASSIWNAMFWNWKIDNIEYNDVTNGKNQWYECQKVKGSPLLSNKIMSSKPTTHAKDTLCDAIRKKIDENQKFISEIMIEKDEALKTIKIHEQRELKIIEMLQKAELEVKKTEQNFENIKESYTELENEKQELIESHNATQKQYVATIAEMGQKIKNLENQISNLKEKK